MLNTWKEEVPDYREHRHFFCFVLVSLSRVPLTLVRWDPDCADDVIFAQTVMMYSNYHWVEVCENPTHRRRKVNDSVFFLDTNSQNLRPPRFPLNRKLPIVGDLHTLRTSVYSYTRSVQCSCWDAYTSELHCKQIGFFSSFVLISFGSSASWILIMNINSPRHRHSSQQQCF